MPVEDLFSVGGATVASGKIRRGEIQSGAAVEIAGLRGTRTATVTRVEVGGQQATRGRAEDAAKLHLSGVARSDMERGDVVSAPSSIAPHRRFKAKITVDPGGQSVRNGFRPQFRVFVADVTGTVTLPAGTTNIPPSGEAEATVELVQPSPCERGLELDVLVGGRRIARAVITELLD